MKARFITEQLPVNVVETEKAKYIFICINGEKKMEKFENYTDESPISSVTEQEYWEYDYNEFSVKNNDNFDIEDVKAHPENYINYGKKKTELEIYKEEKIAESKRMLEEYLSTHPLLSTVKYFDGRYYSVTAEKQRQLTSKMAMYSIYSEQSLPYNLLKWNDTGNVCEAWTIEELTQHSMEIDAYVTPLVSIQQQYEVRVKEAENIKDIDKIMLKYE